MHYYHQYFIVMSLCVTPKIYGVLQYPLLNVVTNVLVPKLLVLFSISIYCKKMSLKQYTLFCAILSLFILVCVCLLLFATIQQHYISLLYSLLSIMTI